MISSQCNISICSSLSSLSLAFCDTFLARYVVQHKVSDRGCTKKLNSEQVFFFSFGKTMAEINASTTSTASTLFHSLPSCKFPFLPRTKQLHKMNFHSADNYIKVMHLLPDCCTWLEQRAQYRPRSQTWRLISGTDIPSGDRGTFLFDYFQAGPSSKTDDTLVYACVWGGEVGVFFFFVFFRILFPKQNRKKRK